MELRTLSPREYAALFPQGTPGTHLYNTAAFSELMASVADRVCYLAMADSKVRAGLVAGFRAGEPLSPFSAPFGGLSFTKEQAVETVDECISLVKQALPSLRITLPPDFYFPQVLAKERSAMLRAGSLEYADINHHYPICRAADFERYLDRSARQKLHEAERHPWKFEVLDSADSAAVKRAYAVIQANRSAKGYPLRMSLQQVLDTIPVASTKFMVMSLDGTDVAAAQIQQATRDIWQVVYWGDAPGFSQMRPMNIFPRFVVEQLAGGEQCQILDIGPSSQQGHPDYGLCVYKESIGCIASLKPTFRL